MKQKDIALIIVVVAVAAFASFFLSRLLFQSGDKREQTAEVVDVITSEFNPPDEKYFNVNAVNPTQLIRIGDNNNQNPFNKKGQ